jgi:hypothetical protein
MVPFIFVKKNGFNLKKVLISIALTGILFLIPFHKLSCQQIINQGTEEAFIKVDLMDHSYFFRMMLVNELMEINEAKVIASEEAGVIYIYPFKGQFDKVYEVIESFYDKISTDEKKLNKIEETDLILSLKEKHGTWLEKYALKGERDTPNDSCHVSMPFCTGTIYTFPAGTSTISQLGPNYNCLYTQPNPAWYHMKIGTPGSITIKMSSSPEKDIDFCLWGPFDDPVSPCPMNNTNGGLTISKIIDCSYSYVTTEYAEISTAIAGKYYILVITNYSNVACDITFQQTSGTGTTDCTILPPPASNNSPVCVGQSIHLSAANVYNATYNWTGPAGFTSNQQNPVINNAQPANAGIYSLTITVNGTTSEPTTTEVVVESILPAGIIPQGATSLCKDAPDTPYSASPIPGAESYQWNIIPADAGTISGTGITALVNWSALFQGQAFIGVAAVNSCGSGPIAPLLEVTILGEPSEPDKPSGPDALCQGNQPTQYTINSSVNATSYEWILQPAGAGNISGSGQTITINWAGGFYGTAQLKVRAINSCGNSTWSPALDIAVSELPGICNSPIGPVVFCQSGESGNYNTAPVANALSYHWTLYPSNAGIIIGSSQAVTINWSPSFSGIANISVAAQNSCGSGTTSPSLSVNILPDPQASAGNDTTVNSGAVIVLKGGVSGSANGFQFHWEPAEFLINPNMMRPTTIALTESKNYILSVTKTGTQCTYQDEVFVEVLGSPLTASITATPAQICAGASSQLHAQGYGGNMSNYQYSWYQNGSLFSTQQSPHVTPSVTTTYTVEVFDGISTFTGTVNVVVWQLALANAGPDKQIDFNTSTVLTGSASPQGMYIWHWQPVNKLINPAIQNPITVPLIENTLFTLTVVDLHGCISLPDNVLVTVTGGEMLATSSADPPAICAGASSVLSVQVSGGNAGNYQYSWTQNGVLLGQNQTITVSPTQSTTYQVEVWDGFNTVSSNVTVMVWPLPLANAGEPITIPNGTNTQLNGSATLGDDNYQFYWEPSNMVDNPTLANPNTILLNASTNYSLTVTDGKGCQDNDQVTVTVTGGLLNASITASPNEICMGQSTLLSVLVSGGSSNYIYTWTSLPPGFHSTLKDVTVNPEVNTIYKLQVFDGFATFDAQVSVIVNPLPLTNAGSDQTINNGMSAMLSSTVTGGAPPYTFLWNPTGLVLAPTMPATPTNNLFASQLFDLQVTDSKGCLSDDQVEISISGGPLQVNPVAENPVICLNESTILRAIPGGGSNNYLTFNWTGSDGFTSQDNAPLVSPHETTSYLVDVYDGFNHATGEVTVVVNTLPEINLIPDDPRVVVLNSLEIGACVYDTILLDAGNTNSVYLWNNGSTSQKIMVCTSGLSFDVKTSQVVVSDLSTGCQSTASLTVYFTFQNCSYGVDEVSGRPGLLVYPNPSHDGIFMVKLDESKNWDLLEISSPMGNLIHKQYITDPFYSQSEVNLDLRHLAKGVYFLKALGKDGILLQPIIISN